METVFYSGPTDKDWTDETKAMRYALEFINKIMLTNYYDDESARNEIALVQKRLADNDLSRAELTDYLTQACIDHKAYLNNKHRP